MIQTERAERIEMKRYFTFIRKSEGNRPLGGSRHRWELNIKIYVTEIS
jgi:hypothetical protein